MTKPGLPLIYFSPEHLKLLQEIVATEAQLEKVRLPTSQGNTIQWRRINR